MRIRIRGGRIIDPANRVDAIGDVCIADGVIASAVDANPEFTAERDIDAGGRLVTPGFVDLSARFREPGFEYKASFASETAAAASAGVTTVCCPPDTDPVIDTTAVVELIHQRTQECGRTRVYPLGALTHGLDGERLAEMYTLRKAGCVGVSNANRPLANTEVLRRAMEYAGSYGITVFLCPEDPWLRNDGVIHEGAVSTRLGLPAIPESAETVAVGTALLLSEQTGAQVHFCRLSAARSIALVAAARRDGLPVTADCAITQLHLTEYDVDDYNVYCHLRPPLRSRRDLDALRRAVADGVLDAVCSDHQPHDDDAKSAPFSQTEPGASTIELLYPLLAELTVDGAIPLATAVAALTVNPARILGLDLGTLGVGAPADVAIIDPDHDWTVDRHALLSAGKNSPFHGRRLTGRITHTLLAGRLVYGPDA